MSEEHSEIKVLDDALVAEYLRRHPDFFMTQDELLGDLRVPHTRGGTVSLVERQLSVLRERSQEMRQRLVQLVDVARDNDRLFELTRELTLDLLDADSLDTLVPALEDGLRNKFKVPYVSFILFANTAVDVGRSVPLAAAQQEIAGLLGESAVCGTLRASEQVFLFGAESAAVIQSAAVAGIGEHKPLGVLALGSPDSQHYTSTMGTLFLTFIVQVLARTLPRLMRAER